MARDFRTADDQSRHARVIGRDQPRHHSTTVVGNERVTSQAKLVDRAADRLGVGLEIDVPSPFEAVTRPGKIKQMQRKAVHQLRDNASKSGGVKRPPVDKDDVRPTAKPPLSKHSFSHPKVVVRAHELGAWISV